MIPTSYRGNWQKREEFDRGFMSCQGRHSLAKKDKILQCKTNGGLFLMNNEVKKFLRQREDKRLLTGYPVFFKQSVKPRP